MMDTTTATSFDKSTNSETSIIEKCTKVNRLTTRFDFKSMDLSPDCSIGINSIPNEIFNEYAHYTLEAFYENRVAPRRRFFKRIPMEQIISYSDSMISAPLLKLNDELETLGVQIFKYLLAYMGDRRSVKTTTQNAQKHISLTLNSVEDLKDEAYCQVLKQMNNNPSTEKALKAWNFFAIMASSYAPSTELYYAILNYLARIIRDNEDELFVKRANYIIVRLYRTFESRRKEVPTEQEIEHIEAMKPVMFPVSFFSNTQTVVPTESYTTVRELKTTIMNKLQLSISRTHYYSLYEICKKKNVIEERFLDDYEKVVDITSAWTQEEETYKSQNETIDFKIYLKIQLYFDYNETDHDTITMLYVQNAYDVLAGKLKLNENDAIILGAIKLFVDIGPNNTNEALKVIKDSLTEYVATPFNLKFNLNYWQTKLIEKYVTFNFNTRNEAKLAYLEHLKSSPLWEAHQFIINFSKALNKENPEKFPEKLILGIKPLGLSIFDQDKNELLYVAYNKIIAWGINEDIFVVIVEKNQGELNKFYFECDQTKMIQALIENYTGIISGKSINEIINDSYLSMKRFEGFKTKKNNATVVEISGKK